MNCACAWSSDGSFDQFKAWRRIERFKLRLRDLVEMMAERGVALAPHDDANLTMPVIRLELRST